MRKRIGPKRESGIAELKEIASTLKATSERRTLAERLLSSAASIAQIGTLCAVVIGYIYTVVPVMQKESLSEQLAILKREQEQWSKKIEVAKASVAQKEQALAELSRVKVSLDMELQSLESRAAVASAELERYKELSLEKEATLAEAEQAITVATSDLYVMHEERFITRAMLIYGAQTSNLRYRAYFNPKGIQATAADLAEAYPKPLETGRERLAHIAKLHEDSVGVEQQSLLQLQEKYRSGLEKYASELSCETPNYKEWPAAYASALDYAENYAIECSKRITEAHLIDNGWTKSMMDSAYKTNQLKGLLDEAKHRCEHSSIVEVTLLFDNAWLDVINPCIDKLVNMDNLIFGKIDASEFVSRVDTTPPSMALVKQTLEGLEKDKRM